MSFFWVGHFEFFFRKKKYFFCFIPMKISPNLYGRMDGSKFWCFPWFRENSLLCVILRYTVYQAIPAKNAAFFKGHTFPMQSPGVQKLDWGQKAIKSLLISNLNFQRTFNNEHVLRCKENSLNLFQKRSHVLD